MAEDYLKYPYSPNHVIYFNALQLTVEAQAVAVEDESADDGLQQVVGKGHLSYGPHQRKQPFENSGTVEQH